MTTHVKVSAQVPSVSIGMPIYNGAQYLRVALDSVSRLVRQRLEPRVKLH